AASTSAGCQGRAALNGDVTMALSIALAVWALLAIGQAHTSPASACGGGQQADARSDVTFCYPASWIVTTDASDAANPRFARVEIVAPAHDELILVRYRTASDYRDSSDASVLMDFSHQHCRDALERGDIPSPSPSSSALYVKSFVRRSLT